MNFRSCDFSLALMLDRTVENLCSKKSLSTQLPLGQSMRLSSLLAIIHTVLACDTKWRLYEACGVCILELKDGTVIYMLVERRYPLSKELLQRMLDLGLEVEEESTAALHLDQTVPVQKQTAFGKDKSNPLIVDSLLKTIRLSIHLVVYNEELAIPEQTATGKGISNPLMAGSLPKTTKPT
ncbi:hypothetical protein Tco_0708728 [Tanacetum coccineum]